MPIKKSSDTSKVLDNRARSWTFIVYPESVPNQWRDILDEEHIAWIESPLHDKDINATGEPKKAHWHILLLFEGKKSFEQIKEITDKLNAPIPQKCASAKSLVRYMAHLDNPDKAQYDKLGIIAHGGADLDALFAPSASQRNFYLNEMRLFIKANDILEYEDIYDYAAEERSEDWFPLLNENNTLPIKSYINSRRHRRERPTGNARYGVYDKKTGELLDE
jgi:hypothetical protein